MKFSALIDNIHSVEWGLTINEAYTFSWIYALPSWVKDFKLDGDNVYYFGSRNKFIEDMPLITDKPDTVYRIIKRLESSGLILHMKIGDKDYISITPKGSEWNNNKNIISDLNPDDEKYGSKSQNERIENREGTEGNPAYYIINNNIIKDNNIMPENKIQANKKQINIPFEEFWNLYDRKEDKKNCFKKWHALTDNDRRLIMEDIPKYFSTLSNPIYKKYPYKYLNGEMWLDERNSVQNKNPTIKTKIHV